MPGRTASMRFSKTPASASVVTEIVVDNVVEFPRSK